MKRTVVLGVLAMIGMLALSATAAHAGGRGIPVALTSFFVCHATNGANLATKVEVQSDESQGGSPLQTLITLGNAVLACAQANLFTPATGTTPRQEIDPAPDELGLAFELKCYSVSTQKKSGQSNTLAVEDSLLGLLVGEPTAAETVSIARDARFVCAPARLTEPPPPQ